MSITRTYKALVEIPEVKIVGCSAILPNHMQCWRSGDVQVTETASDTEEDGSITKQVHIYQLCRRHALIQIEADAQLLAEEAEIEDMKQEPAEPEAEDPEAA